jgi:hypothetical protein
MRLGVRDIAATLLTAAVVACFMASYQGWGVPLVGDSHRWAAGAVMLLGIATCSLGSAGEGASVSDVTTIVLMTLGGAALVAGVLAIVTGSLTVLGVLVAIDVLLWAATTLRHVLHLPHRPITA